MNILEALKNPVLQLPKAYKDEDYPTFLTKLFRSYQEVIDGITEGSIVDKLRDNRELLHAFCEALLSSVNTYYSGFPAKSYFEFEKAITTIEEYLVQKNRVLKNPYGEEPYYRARSAGEAPYERKGMFHMPFEKREYVNTQRYSVPGFPCLYLSNSIYACWEELDQPDFNTMQVSRLKRENPSLNFIDISTTPEFLLRMLEVTTDEEFLAETKQTKQQALDSWDKLILDYLMKWPLIAACSIKVRLRTGAFKPEYILPQFLIQFVTGSRRFDGIMYFSIAAHVASKVNYATFINYAIPVKQISTEGLCRFLTDAFSLTEPISWGMLIRQNPDILKQDEDKEKIKRIIGTLAMDTLLGVAKFEEEEPTGYRFTKYGKLEIELSEMPVSKIVDNL